MKNICLILALAFGLLQTSFAQNSNAVSRPGLVYVNGVQHHTEAFILNGVTLYKIQDMAVLFSNLLPKFSYKIREGQLHILTNRNQTANGSELSAAQPGAYEATQISSSVTVDGKTVSANVYEIRGNYCLSEEDISRIADVGRKALPEPRYTGVEFATNFSYTHVKGERIIKEPSEVGNLSFNLGRWGIALEYNGYIFVIHKNKIFRVNNDGSGIKEFKNVKAAHSLNGYKERVYFYAYGYKVMSVDLNGDGLREEICPLYGLNAGIEGQEPQSITYLGDMAIVKYNNCLQNNQWTDEIRWYATSGRSEEVVYRINSAKRVIGDFFLDKNYVYFSVNWANRKDLNKIGKLGDKEALIEGNVSQLFKVENKMYFKGGDDNLMYEMPMGGKSGRKKISNIIVNRFYVKDNQVIYQKQEALYIMNLNGSGQKRLVAGGVKNFNVAGRWIVYSERDNTNFGAKVALVSIDGSKNVKLPD